MIPNHTSALLQLPLSPLPIALPERPLSRILGPLLRAFSHLALHCVCSEQRWATHRLLPCTGCCLVHSRGRRKDFANTDMMSVVNMHAPRQLPGSTNPEMNVVSAPGSSAYLRAPNE